MIVGLGGVGMMGLEIAQAITDATHLAADIAPEKREAALARGAAASFDPLDRDARRKAVLPSVGAVDAAIDFVGSELSLAFAQSVVGKGGAVIVVGLMGGRFSLPVPMFPLRELTITGSYVGTLAEAHELIALAQARKDAPIPIASGRLPKPMPRSTICAPAGSSAAPCCGRRLRWTDQAMPLQILHQ